jgi:hypothetical protein
VIVVPPGTRETTPPAEAAARDVLHLELHRSRPETNNVLLSVLSEGLLALPRPRANGSIAIGKVVASARGRIQFRWACRDILGRDLVHLDGGGALSHLEQLLAEVLAALLGRS